MTTNCGQQRLAIGAYVVGALDPAERSQLEAHLADCPQCRGELTALAGLPGLLARVDPDRIDYPGPPHPGPAVLDRALTELTRRRRRTRRLRLLAVAAAALIAAGAGGIGFSIGTHPTTPAGPVTAGPRPVAASGTDPTSGVRGTAQLLATPWGSTIHLTLTGLTPGQQCRLIAVTANGTTRELDTWVVNYSGRANIDEAINLPPAQLAQLRIATTTGTDLLTLALS